MKKQQKYWIKERSTPLLGTYFIACSQMSKRLAKQHEHALYGSSEMHPFDTKEEYEARITHLRSKGERVQ